MALQDLALVMSYSPLGSLCSYLKGHCLSWRDLCHVVVSVAKGLAAIHGETRADNAVTICHR